MKVRRKKAKENRSTSVSSKSVRVKVKRPQPQPARIKVRRKVKPKKLIDKAHAAFPNIVGRDAEQRWKWSLRDFLQECRVPDAAIQSMIGATQINWKTPEEMSLEQPIPCAVMESFRFPAKVGLEYLRWAAMYWEFILGKKSEQCLLLEKATHLFVDALTSYDERIKKTYSHWKPFENDVATLLRDEGYGHKTPVRASPASKEKGKEETGPRSGQRDKGKHVGDLRSMAPDPNGKRKGLVVRKRRVNSH